MNIITEATRTVTVDPHRTFDTFAEAWFYTRNTCHYLQGKGHAIMAAKVWQDRFKQYRPRDLQSQLLGFGKQAVRECERLAPGGKWTVLRESPSPHQWLHATGGWQFSVAYSKYLPYAYAMMQAEDGYKAFGLDFDSINSYFGTCMGYGWIGMGHFPGHDEADFNLYDELACTSHQVKRPQLPFDEVWNPACCFVRVRRPDMFEKTQPKGGNAYEHTAAVLARCANRLPKLLAA